MASATYNFDFRGGSTAPMQAYPGGTAPYIYENVAMPPTDRFGVRGDGILQLPFKFITGGFSVRWHLSNPGEDIGGNIHQEFMMLTADEQRGFSFVATRTAEIPTVIQQRVYQIEGGVKSEVGLLGATDAGGWQVMPAAAQDSGKFAVTFSYHSSANNANLTTDIDVLMADVTKIVWHDNDESNTSLLYGFLTGNDVEVPSVEGNLRVLDGSSSVTFGVNNKAAPGEEADVFGGVVSTNPLRIAFPHDIIFTSGLEMVPYSGYFWPPSTPIPPSQIYIPRGPDPITGEPNFKRMQWQVTTADTPREIWLGETPGFSYGDPDVPGAPPSNC